VTLEAEAVIPRRRRGRDKERREGSILMDVGREVGFEGIEASSRGEAQFPLCLLSHLDF